MRLSDKMAIVAGEDSGIGRASAIIFAKEGAKVVVADINDNGGDETVAINTEKNCSKMNLNVP